MFASQNFTTLCLIVLLLAGAAIVNTLAERAHLAALISAASQQGR